MKGTKDNPYSFQEYSKAMFNRLAHRSLKNDWGPLSFTLEEFRDWARARGLERLLRNHRKHRSRHMDGEKRYLPKGTAPCVDRINSYLGYSFENMQLITHAQNSVKGAGASLGTRELAMRFFKRLRERLGLTKYEMARHLNILPQSYYYYEDQAKGCSFEILCLLKQKLGVSWEELGQMIEEDVATLQDKALSTVTQKVRKSKKVGSS